MKLPALCLLLTAFLSQAQNAANSVVQGIEMQTVNSDTLAIRALEYKDGSYWFAGKDGHYGSLNALNNILTIKQLPPVAQTLEFRSIAVTATYVYVMSAGSPALCYRVDKKTGRVDEIYRDMDERAFYDSMKFWNDREGIIIGDPMNSCFSLLKTTDAGATFTKIECAAFPDFVDGEAAFAASNSNIVIKEDDIWFATGGTRARVFYSPDRGASWTAIDTPIIAGGAMTGIFAMDFYDTKKGVVIGGNWDNKNDTSANKAMTTDGGLTWTLINQGEEPPYCSDIQFIPNTSGKELIAVGSEGCWWSGDHGNSWMKLTDKGFYTVAMEDSTHGVLAGRNEIVRFTLSRKRHQ